MVSGTLTARPMGLEAENETEELATSRIGPVEHPAALFPPSFRAVYPLPIVTPSPIPPSGPSVPGSGIELEPGVPICQTDLPLDWYQEEFKPYAEEYLA